MGWLMGGAGPRRPAGQGTKEWDWGRKAHGWACAGLIVGSKNVDGNMVGRGFEPLTLEV